MFYQDICNTCVNKQFCEKCNKYFKKSHICSVIKTDRFCNQCKLTKPLIEFYPSKYRCIKCLKEKDKCDICNKIILKRNMNHHKITHQSDKAVGPD